VTEKLTKTGNNIFITLSWFSKIIARVSRKEMEDYA